MSTHFIILAWRTPFLAEYSPWGQEESDMNEAT